MHSVPGGSESAGTPLDTGAGWQPDAEFDLHNLQPAEVPGMSDREKRAAWALGASGAIAGLALGTALGAAALYAIATLPVAAWWALLAAVG